MKLFVCRYTKAVVCDECEASVIAQNEEQAEELIKENSSFEIFEFRVIEEKDFSYPQILTETILN